MMGKHQRLIIIVGLGVIAVTMTGCSPSGTSSRAPAESAIAPNFLEEEQNTTKTGKVLKGSDPLYHQQWHLKNTGQKSYSATKAVVGEDMRVEPVHQQGIYGRGVVIAVSDNGVDISHPDLRSRANLSLSKNYALSSSQWTGGNPAPDESQGSAAHGTAVAGLALATGWNSEGVRGVAPLATLAAFRFIGTGVNLAKLVDQAKGPYDIFNYSYGRDTCSYNFLSTTFLNQLRYGAFNGRGGKGSLYVKAGGNEYIAPRKDCLSGAKGNYTGNSNFEEDNNQPWVIVVGAVDSMGSVATYSTPGSSLFISAPGGDFGDTYPALLTTDLEGCNRGYARTTSGLNDFDQGKVGANSGCAYTSTMNGTSGSAPLVSGAIALLIEANPSLSWREIRYILAKTARPIDTAPRVITHPLGSNFQLANHSYLPHWQTNGAGFHFHHWYGLGVVNVEEAVKFARTKKLSLGPWTEERLRMNNLNLPIPDADPEGVESSVLVSRNLNLEAVQVELRITHPYPSDLGIELISPAGTRSVLKMINSGITDKNLHDVVFATYAPFMENSQGEWTLKVLDAALLDEGELISWELILMGHTPSSFKLNQQSTDSFSDETDSLDRLRVFANEQDPDPSLRFAVTSVANSSTDSSIISKTQLKASAPSSVGLIHQQLFSKDDPIFLEDTENESASWLAFHQHGELYIAQRNAQGVSLSRYLADSETFLELWSAPLAKTEQLVRAQALGREEVLLATREGDRFHLRRFDSLGKVLNSSVVIPRREDWKVVGLDFVDDEFILALSAKHELALYHHGVESIQELDYQASSFAYSQAGGIIAGVRRGEFGAHSLILDTPTGRRVLETDAELEIFSLELGPQGYGLLFGTRTNLIQSNFGDLDLALISLSFDGELVLAYHWGREQSLINPDGLQRGIGLHFTEQGIELIGFETLRSGQGRLIFLELISEGAQ
jgi:subtilisin-like proprotein convertase family protein